MTPRVPAAAAPDAAAEDEGAAVTACGRRKRCAKNESRSCAVDSVARMWYLLFGRERERERGETERAKNTQ